MEMLGAIIVKGVIVVVIASAVIVVIRNSIQHYQHLLEREKERNNGKVRKQ